MLTWDVKQQKQTNKQSSLVVTYWKRTHLLAILCVVFSCVCATCPYVSWSTSELRVRSVPLNMFKPSSAFYWVFQGDASFMDPFCYLRFTFVFIILSCLFLATLWSTDLLALFLYDVTLCFVTFPYGASGQVWYLIVSIPDLCLLYFYGNLSSLAIILLRKRELVVLLYLFVGFCVLCFFLMVLCVVLRSVIVVFLGHTHLLFV